MGKSTISIAIFHCYVSSPAGNYNGISHDSPGQGGEPPENRREARERCPPVAMAGKTRFFENHWEKTWENSGENSENGKDHRKIRDCWVKYPLETTLNLHTDTVNPCSFFFPQEKHGKTRVLSSCEAFRWPLHRAPATRLKPMPTDPGGASRPWARRHHSWLVVWNSREGPNSCQGYGGAGQTSGCVVLPL